MLMAILHYAMLRLATPGYSRRTAGLSRATLGGSSEYFYAAPGLPLRCDHATLDDADDYADDYAEAMLSIFKMLMLISPFRRLCNYDIISLWA